MEAIKVRFEIDEPKKSCVKYAEVTEGGMPPRIGNLYVQNWALGMPKAKPPQALDVTITEAK